jgi:hypothetical protein
MNKNLPLFLWIVLQSSILDSIQAQTVRAVDTTFKKYLPSENGLDHRLFKLSRRLLACLPEIYYKNRVA